jgi:hypothetical protein
VKFAIAYPGQAIELKGSRPSDVAKAHLTIGKQNRKSGAGIMKNKLSDLNDHLFAQLERLSEENLTPEQIETEVKRSNAVVGVADQILRHATLQVQAAKIMSDHGLDPTPHLPQIGTKSLRLNGTKALNGAQAQ